MKNDNATVLPTRTLGSKPAAPHFSQGFTLEQPIVTIRTNNGRRQAAIITGVEAKADEFISMQLSNLGQRVKNLSIGFKGRIITNVELSGAALASEELDHVNAWLEDNKAEFSAGEDVYVFNANVEYTKSGARKGEILLRAKLKGSSDVRANNLPVNLVTDTKTGNEVRREDNTVLGPVKDLAKDVIHGMLEAKEWHPFLKTVAEGGYVQEEATNDNAKTEEEDHTTVPAPATATAGATGGASEEGDLSS